MQIVHVQQCSFWTHCVFYEATAALSPVTATGFC
jgi:hypothetical protein